jgi:hypothetical protein
MNNSTLGHLPIQINEKQVLNCMPHVHLVILGVLLIILLVGCAPAAAGPTQQAVPATLTPFSDQDFVLSPAVEGCAKTDEGMASKAGGGQDEQKPVIEVSGNTIRYTRALNHQCCRKVAFEKVIEGTTIAIYEVWSGAGCKCMCYSKIGISLEHVPTGSYTVHIFESGTKPGSNEPLDQQILITENVTIP